MRPPPRTGARPSVDWRVPYNGYRPNVLFAGERICVGLFRALPNDPFFVDSGPARSHLVVFPRLPVTIAHEGQEPVVADATRVMLYNRGQVYHRRALSRHGDRALWLAFEDADTIEATRSADDGVHPFRRSHAPVDAVTRLESSMLLRRLRAGDADPLFVEEAALSILAAVLGATTTPLAVRPQHLALAERLRAALHRPRCEPPTLATLSREAGASPYHAARVFRAVNGTSVHACLDELRLYRALERLLAGAEDLTELALDVGYASHSHFTFAFRRRFGVPPRAVRALAERRRVRELQALLVASPALRSLLGGP